MLSIWKANDCKFDISVKRLVPHKSPKAVVERRTLDGCKDVRQKCRISRHHGRPQTGPLLEEVSSEGTPEIFALKHRVIANGM